MEIITAISTLVLATLTAVYVWITHKLLQETVNANNEYKKVSEKQLFSQAMPELYASFESKNNETLLVISNTGVNPCYDIEAHVFGVYDEKIKNISQFIVEHVKQEHRSKCAGITPCDSNSYSVWDYSFINVFLANKGSKIPLCFPYEPEHCQVFLQYKDRLGNNYSQTFCYFKREDERESIMSLEFVYPTVLEPTKQISLFDLISRSAKEGENTSNNCPGHVEELLIYGNHSINSSHIDCDSNMHSFERGKWFNLDNA